MSDIELLEKLVETWRNKWLLDAETLDTTICRDHPELFPEFQRRVAEIKLLDELVGQYEERRSSGESPTPEEMCREHPELLERFRDEVRKLNLFDSAFGPPEEAVSLDAASVGKFCDGRYSVEGVLNQGGQGIIYTARDTELGRTVVVKGPGRRGLGQEALGRLEQEAHTTGRLEHPGVVPVYGFGRDASGKPYYAMKFIDGETLSAAISRYHQSEASASEPSRQALDFQRLLRNFAQVCQTIAYAHNRGIVHRDIKPINIMLGKFGEVWVVDWGLAKRVPPGSKESADSGKPPESGTNDASSVSSVAPTTVPESLAEGPTWAVSQSYSIKGTLFYMSPEQAEARNSDVGPASDIYSLGATLYELLTGKPPVHGTSPREILDRVIAGRIVPAREARPGVPPALDAICSKAMRVRIDDRYASAADLAAEIEKWLADEPVSAWPEPWTRRAARWLRRHRTVMTGAVAAILVGIVGLGLLAAQQSVARSRLDRKNTELNVSNQKLDIKNTELNEANVKLQIANRNEKTAAQRARDNAAEARRQELLARDLAAAERVAKDEARQMLYFSRIALARNEWLANNMRRTRQILDTCDESLRGWEWRYCNRLCATELRQLSADWPVTCISQSQNGRVIAAGRSDGGVAVWVESLKPGEYLRIPKEISLRPERPVGKFEIEIAAIAVNPTGKLLAAASRRSWRQAVVRSMPEVRICDAVSGVLEFSIPVEAHSLAFSPDGKTLAVGLASGSLEVWDVAEKKKLSTSVVGRGSVSGIAFSPSGTHLAASEMVGTVKVWSLTPDEAPLHEFALTASGLPNGVAFSADGERLAAGNGTGDIDLWNLKALREKDESVQTRLSLIGHTGQVRSVALHPARPILASASYDRTVKLWDAELGKECSTLRGHDDLVTAVMFGPGGTQLISGSQDSLLKFWNPLEEQEGAARPGQTFSLSGDGRYLATTWLARPHPLAEGAKTVWVWEAASGKPVRTFEGHAGHVSCVALSADGKLAASGGGALSKGEALVWNVETGIIVWKLEARAGDITRIALSPNRKFVATLSAGDSLAATPGEIRLWNLTTGKLIYSLDAGEGEPASLAFDKHSKLLAVAKRRRPVRLLDAATGKEVLVLPRNSHHSAAFDAEGKRVVTTGGSDTEGGKIWIWNVDTGQLALELAGHSKTVLAAAFSGDGARLATAGEDGAVRLWDVATRQEILTLPHGGEVNDVEFSARDEMLVSSSGSFFFPGSTRIWRAPHHASEK